jgi:predicted alpha/beta-hydrolase family hydrolase
MQLLWDGPDDAAHTLVLGHSAGSPMDSPWLTAMCAQLAGRGIRTARFEFAYMAARRDGLRRPPLKAELAVDEYRDAVAAVIETAGSAVAIGGKSYGGRVASLLADELHDARSVTGLVCLGYPFHPPQKPDATRTGHLLGLRCPALICQGTGDPFGSADEVAGYGLPASIHISWFAGDHDVQPRTKLGPVADAVAGFVTGLSTRRR